MSKPGRPVTRLAGAALRRAPVGVAQATANRVAQFAARE
jgi:hypothetical protein